MSPGPGDHRWWLFDGPRHFAARAGALLGPATQRGHRVVLATEPSARQHWPDTMPPSGHFELLEAEALYQLVVEKDADGRRGILFDAVARAIADGYSGLTILVDATRVVSEAGDPF
jgi:hypothetical protein